MATYNPVEYWILIPKIIEYVMFMILGIKTYRMKNYIVNKIIGLAFFTWTFYTFPDLLQWIIGANSEEMLAFANILRDIQVFAAMIFAYLIFLDSEIIKYGEKAVNKKKLGIVLGIYMVLTVLLAITENLYVADINDPNKIPLDPSVWAITPMVEVASDLDLVTAVLMVFPLLLYVLSIKTLLKIAQKSQSAVKTKMIQLIIGISLIPVGIIYFAILMGIGLTLVFQLVFYSIGRVFWVSAAFVIWNSQRASKKSMKEIAQ